MTDNNTQINVLRQRMNKILDRDNGLAKFVVIASLRQSLTGPLSTELVKTIAFPTVVDTISQHYNLQHIILDYINLFINTNGIGLTTTNSMLVDVPGVTKTNKSLDLVEIMNTTTQPFITTNNGHIIYQPTPTQSSKCIRIQPETPTKYNHSAIIAFSLTFHHIGWVYNQSIDLGHVFVYPCYTDCDTVLSIPSPPKQRSNPPKSPCTTNKLTQPVVCPNYNRLLDEIRNFQFKSH